MPKEKQTYEYTGAWRGAFLAALRVFPNISKAAKSAHITRQAAYQARAIDPEFHQQWEDAWQEGIEYIEDVALSRATRKKNPSDTLIIFMLKGLKPEVYREHFDGTMTLRGAVGVSHKLDLSALSDEQLEFLQGIYEQSAIVQAATVGQLAEPGGNSSGAGDTSSS